MTLSELWAALARGEREALQTAYLHRVMRERDGVLIKGRQNVAADWDAVLGGGGACEVIADLGDMAVVRVGNTVWHHWVRREDGRIGFEVLIAAEGDCKDDRSVVERSVTANGQIAELFHLFHQDASEATRRQIGSRVLGWDHNVISVEINNG
jgi:hypothetical protein